jgi:transmembrane sensor
MKLKFNNYSLEDLASERSFINYCLNSNDKDVNFWNEWILDNPERNKDVNLAREIVTKYSLGLDQSELNFERNKFLEHLNLIGSQSSESKQILNHKSLWYYTSRIAAVFVVAVGISVSIFQQSGKFSIETVSLETTIKQNPAGQKSTIYLSDGTKVILNAQSSLLYNNDFGSEKREVKLTGEAFFEVSKDPKKPFIVRTGDIITTVLGTSFNVNAFPEMRNIQVAVMTGKVKVETSANADDSNTAQELHLLPTEMAVYNTTDKTLVPTKFSLEEISWKDGIIFFKNTNEPMALAKLERWYGVEFEIVNKSPRLWDITAEYDNISL